MTEEFYKRMQEAIKKSSERKMKVIEDSEVVAEVYRNIVIGFVETYDFVTNTFKRDLMSDELKKLIGNPEDIETYKMTYEEGKENLGAIKLKYEKNNLSSLVMPHDYDLEMVNEILDKDEIIIEDATVSGNRHINIYYNPSVILAACDEFVEKVYGVQKVKNPNETV